MNTNVESKSTDKLEERGTNKKLSKRAENIAYIAIMSIFILGITLIITKPSIGILDGSMFVTLGVMMLLSVVITTFCLVYNHFV